MIERPEHTNDFRTLVTFIEHYRVTALNLEEQDAAFKIPRHKAPVIYIALSSRIGMVLKACDLDGNTLNNFSQSGMTAMHRTYGRNVVTIFKAAAALLLEAAIFSDIREDEYNARLVRQAFMELIQDERMANDKLKTVLLEGDVEKHENIIFKNFSAMDPYVKVQYKDRVFQAYMAAQVIIGRANLGFDSAWNQPLSPRIANAFRKYLGDPYSSVDTTMLRPSGHRSFSNQSGKTHPQRFWVVWEMILDLFNGYNEAEEPITFKYAWNHPNPDLLAFVQFRGKNVSIGITVSFFADQWHDQVLTIIHELTHRWCNTIDVDHPTLGKCYGKSQCEALARTSIQSLVNADSVARFLMEAFGTAA